MHELARQAGIELPGYLGTLDGAGAPPRDGAPSTTPTGGSARTRKTPPPKSEPETAP